MRKIAHTNHDLALEFIWNIIDSKRDRKAELLRIKEEIVINVTWYYSERSNLEILNANTSLETHKESLLHCFNIKTTPLKRLEKQIIENSYICPYCNIEFSRELDHYLPKEDFPEYSFYAVNLIPCCHSCNQIKWIRWRNWTKRIFLNTYFDWIPNEQFLFIRLKIEDDILVWDFYIDRTLISVSDTLWELLESHMNNFNLSDRYREDFNTIITEEILNSIRGHDLIDVLKLKEFLLWEIRTKNKFWDNYWKTVIYKELSNNSICLSYLIAKK